MTALAGRPLPVLATAVAACVLVVTGAMLAAPVLGNALAEWSPAMQETTFSLLLYGLLAVIALVGRRLASVSGERVLRPAWIALGAAIGIGGLIVTLADAALAGAVVRGAGEGAAVTLLLGSLVMFGQAASEELFFRGWLQPVLARAWGPAVAVGVTAIAFTGLHVAGGARSPLTLVNLLLGGVLFGLLAWRSGGIAASVAAHAGWNWSEGILFGLDPNPGAGSFGAIRDFDLTSAVLWGGSAEGLNASIAMTIVLAAFILPLAVQARVRLKTAPSPAPG